MPTDASSSLPGGLDGVTAYWPAAAVAAAFIVAVFAAGWFSVSMKALKLQLEAVAANKTKLAEARIAAKEMTAKADERLAEMTALHETASKQFWRNEKTWIG
jgi:hypothetical protein